MFKYFLYMLILLLLIVIVYRALLDEKEEILVQVPIQEHGENVEDQVDDPM